MKKVLVVLIDVFKMVCYPLLHGNWFDYSEKKIRKSDEKKNKNIKLLR